MPRTSILQRVNLKQVLREQTNLTKHSPKERSVLPFCCYAKQIDFIFLATLLDNGVALRVSSST